MYFVDRKKIDTILTYMDDCLNKLEQHDEWTTPLFGLALERIAQVLIESILDVGNHLIDGFIMRDPGSYDDIIDILSDEKVIPEESEKRLKELVGYRKQLVQSYTNINHKELLNLLTKHHDVLRHFPTQVRAFIDKELGPVSAFLPYDN